MRLEHALYQWATKYTKKGRSFKDPLPLPPARSAVLIPPPRCAAPRRNASLGRGVLRRFGAAPPVPPTASRLFPRSFIEIFTNIFVYLPHTSHPDHELPRYRTSLRLRIQVTPGTHLQDRPESHAAPSGTRLRRPELRALGQADADRKSV